MPSEKILSEKQAYVAALREKLMNSVAGVVVAYKGISVADDTKLRAELRAAGVEYAVVKNTCLLYTSPGKRSARRPLRGRNCRICGSGWPAR